MKRLVVLFAAVLIVLALTSSASAQTEWRLVFSRAYWLAPCDAHGGLVMVEGEYILPDGFELTLRETLTDPVSGTQTFNITIPTPAMTYSGTFFGAFVPPGGSVLGVFELRSPDNPTLLISVATMYASCVTGEVWAGGITIYGPHEPDPADRVMGTVQYDTPVYAEPDPTQALSATLTAGQTWFVVAEDIGTDGQPWYQVYVGGWNKPWVPASAMLLDGPVPE